MNPPNGPTSGPSDPKNPEKEFGFSALDALESANSLDAVNATGALVAGSAAANTPNADAYLAAKEHALKKRRIIGFSTLATTIIVGVIIIFALQGGQKAADNERQDASKRYPTTVISLAELNSNSNPTVLNNQVLSVNGQLNVNNALVITPGTKPTTAIAGQLYFDQTTNKLMYYDGTQFQSVAAGKDIPVATPTSIGGASGTVGLGNGLAAAGNTLSNTGVLTLQGQAGNVTLVGGPGVVVSGTTLSNSGVLSLGGQNGAITLGTNLSLSGNTLNAAGSSISSVTGTGNISVTDDGSGNLTITTTGQPGMGSVTSSGGTSGKIAVFTGVQNIEDSLIGQSGSTITVTGNLSVTGTTTLSTPLAVSSGGTGANNATSARTNLSAAKSGANSDITSLTGLTTALSVAQGGTGVGTLPTNSVILGNGTSGLNSVVAGASGLCLVSTGGAPTFSACPGAGGVASLNGLTGALSLANASGSGATVTINDATTAAKGIASFNATNFLVSSGAVNTVQNISVTSTPTFGGLTLTTPLAVSSGGTGRNTLTSNGVVVGNGTSGVNTVTGSNGQCLVVSAGTPAFATCPGSGGVSSINSQTGAVTIQGIAGSSVSTSSGVITINDASSTVKGLASFNSTNFSVSSGAVNTVQDIATTSAPSFGQLSIVSNQATGKMLTINNTNAAATGNLLDLQQNGTSRLTVAPNGNLTTSGTISSGLINGQTISSTANFTGSVAVAGNLAVNTIANTGALTVGVGGQSFTLQGNASSTLRSTSGANTTTVGFQSPTANVTYNFAAASAGTYSICTTAGNCVGVGGGVTSTGGTTNTLAKFTGSTAIGDSIISDNGSTVTIGGTLSVNTITPTAALTVGATSQNLTMQGAAVTLNSTSGANTNSLVFASPSGGNKTITVPNATGTVAVSASGPLVLDSLGNLTCPTCLSGGGGGSGVSSVNGLSGALILQSSDAATFTNGGTTITVNDASSTVKGVAKFDATNLTVTSGTVNTVQNISVTSTPTFAGLNLTTALTVGNGGTGATTAGGARTNLGAAASGANSDITSLSGLTTALSVAQGGTGVATTPTNGQILIGNGSGYSLNTLTAGSGINISNTAGSITISAPSAGSCSGCANTALSNLTGVAINTSLLPGTAGGANLGSSTLPFGQLSLAGTSSSPATNNFLITGASTGGVRTITLPDASGTIAVSASGNIALSANGDITFTGQLPVANGGTGANSASGARTNLGAAASGANSDITSLSGLTTALSVAQGGTGATSLTANGILLGNGTSAVTALTGSNGQCLVISGGVPVFTTCPGSGGSYVDLQASTPGTAQTGNFNITGTGIANILQGATFDTPAGTTTLNIGSTNATSISLNQDVVVAGGKTLSLSSALGSNTVLSVQATGDTVPRFTVAADGTIKWGSGSAAQDITLSRNGPNGLNLASNLQTTGLSVSNSLTLPTGIKLFVQPNNGTTVGVVVRANASQSNDLFQFQDSSNNVNASFNATGNTLTLGRIAGSGTVLPGNLIFSDGTTDNFGATLNTTTLSANRTITLPDESGTICLQNSASCGFLTGAAANGSYIQLQGTTPGTAQTGNFNITGTGIAGTLQAANVDRASAGTLAIGNTNATTVNVGTNNSGHTINIGTGTGTQAITIGSTSGLSSTVIQGGDSGIVFNQGTSSTGGYTFTANGGQNILTMDYYGRTVHKALSPTIGTIFSVQNSSSAALLSVNSNDDKVYIQGGGLSVSNSGIVNDGGLTFTSTATTSYITPLGTSLTTKINIINYNPGAYNQLIALGLPNTADTNSRAITIADARASAHQPTIGILSPNETDIAGFSWEGTNDTFSVKTTNNAIMLQTGAGKMLTVNGSTGTAITTIGNGGTIGGRLQLANASNNFMASLQAGTTSADYITQLPTTIGTAGQCLSIASVASITQTLGYSSCLTSSSGVQLQGTTPGTQQTGNLNISGTGIFGTAVSTGILSTTGTVTIGSTAGSGSLTNNGSTVNTTLALGNFSSGGSIGSAASTVDIYTSISVNQTTGSQTLTIPAPTVSTAYGRVIYLSNIGTVPFTLGGTLMKIGSTATFVWSNTNGGASWQYAGADGSSILNQNTTTQTADFQINGTGVATTFTANTFSSNSNVVLQAASGNNVTISPGAAGGGSGTLNLAVNAATLNIGNGSNNARTIAIGNTSGTQAQTITVGNNSGTTSTTTIQGSGGVTLQANTASTGVTVKSVTNSTVAFQVQNASNVSFLTVDTSTSTITLGSSASGNYITFTAAGGLQSFGTARPTKYISLSAEYAGAVLYGGDTGGANCSTNQNGTMTSGYDTSSNQQSYYNWTSTQATDQCFDVVVRVPLPSGFDGWAAAPSIQVRTDDASNSAYAIGIIKSDGSTYDTNYGSAYTSPGTLGTSWANMSTSSLDSSGYTPGSYMTIRIRMTAKSNANLQLGDIKLAYYSKY